MRICNSGQNTYLHIFFSLTEHFCNCKEFRKPTTGHNIAASNLGILICLYVGNYQIHDFTDSVDSEKSIIACKIWAKLVKSMESAKSTGKKNTDLYGSSLGWGMGTCVLEGLLANWSGCHSHPSQMVGCEGCVSCSPAPLHQLAVRGRYAWWTALTANENLGAGLLHSTHEMVCVLPMIWGRRGSAPAN